MILPIQKDGKEVYKCEECGFTFENQEHAHTCETSCSSKGICNNEMAKFTLKEDAPEKICGPECKNQCKCS